MKGITVSNLRDDLSFGSAVTGINWDNIDDPELGEEMRQLFRERGMIVFREMEPTPEMQLALSKVFGPLKDHPTKSTPRADKNLDPGVIDMHRPPRGDIGHDHGLVERDGKKLVSFIPWHFDHTYNDELNYAGVLRAVIKAPVGARTGFADGIDIYKNLDPELRSKIEELSAIYTLDVRLTQMKFGRYFNTFGDTDDMEGNVMESSIFPRAIHPMVWTRPTGEKVAHYCGFSAVGIEGHEDPAGEKLFDEALHEMYRVINPYWHDWELTDLVIWDNHRILHSVEGCDPKYERRMHRTTIKGDYGLGKFEDGKKVGEVKREVTPLALPA